MVNYDVYRHRMDSFNDMTLQDIAEGTGVEIRTLRSWLAQDLLLPPRRQGRGATYPGANLPRALAIRAMREIEGASLADIRRRLWTMSEIEIDAAGAALKPQEQPLNSAAEYLRNIARPSASAGSGLRPAVPPANAPFMRARNNNVRAVTVFTINPDVALHVEGDLPPPVRLEFERIADLVRAILTGEKADAQ